MVSRVPHLYEARSLREVTGWLDDRPSALGLLEVRSANLSETLTWLADSGPTNPQARFVALLDCAGTNRDERDDIAGALLAAGVAEFADSPRRLQRVLRFGRQHAARMSHRAKMPSGIAGIEAWAWTLLPWQEKMC